MVTKTIKSLIFVDETKTMTKIRPHDGTKIREVFIDISFRKNLRAAQPTAIVLCTV